MIRELIILNNDGIPLFYFNFLHRELIDDYQLMGSFLDQIAKFTEISLKENLNKIEWEDLIFLFYTHKGHEPELRLIFKTDNPGRVFIYVKKTLDLIAKTILDKFFSEYKEDLKDFNGEVSRFKPFSKKVEEILSNK